MRSWFYTLCYLRFCSISTHKCTHLLIDAGHISIESDLASKEAIRQVQLKRAQQYTDDDYARLESLMYDKLNLKLEDAQVYNSHLNYTTPNIFISSSSEGIYNHAETHLHRSMIHLSISSNGSASIYRSRIQLCRVSSAWLASRSLESCLRCS
jgi:hypothetical protein